MIIRSARFRNSILTTLADNEMLAIMESAMYHSKSVNDIIRETNISYTTAYRKIKWMVQEGLLIVSSIQITDDGKKSSLFRSTLRSLNVKYELGQIVVDAEKNVEVLEKAAENFFSLKSN